MVESVLLHPQVLRSFSASGSLKRRRGHASVCVIPWLCAPWSYLATSGRDSQSIVEPRVDTADSHHHLVLNDADDDWLQRCLASCGKAFKALAPQEAWPFQFCGVTLRLQLTRQPKCCSPLPPLLTSRDPTTKMLLPTAASAALAPSSAYACQGFVAGRRSDSGPPKNQKEAPHWSPQTLR